MQKLHKAFPVLAAGAFALALVASAAGRTTTSHARVRHVQGRIEALAMDGPRIAYDAGPESGGSNKVLVWNVQTGRTRTVSGKRTRDWTDSSGTGYGLLQLAIAGSRVAWIVNVGGNLEGDDYLFASSLLKPKEKLLATETRNGDTCSGRESNCAGRWLGGLVGSGRLMAVNEWTTDSQGTVTEGELSMFGGHTWNQEVAVGATTVQAVDADGGRVVVLRQDGAVALYSAPAGKVLVTVTPSSRASAAALSGRNLVVLTKAPALEIYDAKTGALRKTLSVHGKSPQNLDVQGTVAIYSSGDSLHAVNLKSGKDRAVGKLAGAIGAARIDSAGLAYASERFKSKGTLVFLPWAKVAAAVG